MRFDDGKTETLNLRVSPTFKQTLRAVADSESRSMVNMLEVILIDYCKRHPTAGNEQPAVTKNSRLVADKVIRKKK